MKKQAMKYLIEKRELWKQYGEKGGEVMATAETNTGVDEVLAILPKAPIGYYYKVLRNTRNYKL